jgi:hypothetical protein
MGKNTIHTVQFTYFVIDGEKITSLRARAKNSQRKSAEVSSKCLLRCIRKDMHIAVSQVNLQLPPSLGGEELRKILNTHPKIRLANEEDGRPNESCRRREE